jgi:hypothetical protein
MAGFVDANPAFWVAGLAGKPGSDSSIIFLPLCQRVSSDTLGEGLGFGPFSFLINMPQCLLFSHFR